MSKPEVRYDAIAVDRVTNTVEIISKNVGQWDADYDVRMSRMKRGTETHTFHTAVTGRYANGDVWVGPQK